MHDLCSFKFAFFLTLSSLLVSLRRDPQPPWFQNSLAIAASFESSYLPEASVSVLRFWDIWWADWIPTCFPHTVLMLLFGDQPGPTLLKLESSGWILKFSSFLRLNLPDPRPAHKVIWTLSTSAYNISLRCSCDLKRPGLFLEADVLSETLREALSQVRWIRHPKAWESLCVFGACLHTLFHSTQTVPCMFTPGQA